MTNAADADFVHPDVRATACFDRLTHHAHGHGGYIAAGGGVGSPFGGRAQADGRCRGVGGVCHQAVRFRMSIFATERRCF